MPYVRLPHRIHLHLAKVSEPTARSVKDVLCLAGKKKTHAADSQELDTSISSPGLFCVCERHELPSRVCAPFRDVCW